MKRLAIIGAARFQLPLIERARSLGLETHVFAWEEGAVGRKAAHRFYPISITEQERILEVLRTIRPDGVASIASDLAMPTVAYCATALGADPGSVAPTKQAAAGVRFVFAPAGVVQRVRRKGGTRAYVEDCELLVAPGDRVGTIRSSADRLGHFLVSADSREACRRRINAVAVEVGVDVIPDKKERTPVLPPATRGAA